LVIEVEEVALGVGFCNLGVEDLCLLGVGVLSCGTMYRDVAGLPDSSAKAPTLKDKSWRKMGTSETSM